MKKGNYSKGVVALLLFVAVLFSGAVLVTFWHTGAEPATLVSCFFGAVVGELWILAGIKKKKIQKSAPDKSASDEKGARG